MVNVDFVLFKDSLIVPPMDKAFIRILHKHGLYTLGGATNGYQVDIFVDMIANHELYVPYIIDRLSMCLIHELIHVADMELSEEEVESAALTLFTGNTRVVTYDNEPVWSSWMEEI